MFAFHKLKAAQVQARMSFKAPVFLCMSLGENFYFEKWINVQHDY